ncbi:cupin domain-containing protein [Marilutibacter alkalisoli]|uniref:Cupin domain-containing protein n=1 Tax=Marilutibacter alkalisoli TaxID=2591633 RepID=A0A514BSW1_9GAMM|nr:cupin domain-containing protein [Lysobacter alkalisoli]QDH70470.1 cupin domain-containing protein [Lysobacter alkalisoli]
MSLHPLHRPWPIILIVVLAALALPTALLAAEPTLEPSVHHRADDPALSWGPCPEFLPPGCAIAVLHGDPAQPNADVFFRVPGGADIAEHWHSSAERMVLVAGELHVTYQDEPTRILTTGSYAYGPPRRAHKAHCAGSGDCVLFIAFEGPVDAVPVPAGD